MHRDVRHADGLPAATGGVPCGAMRRLLIPLAMSVALVACGDSGVSKSAYVAKADAFCAKANAEGKRRNARLAQIATEAHSESEFWGKAIPELEDGLEWARDQQAAFRRIEPPEDDRDTVEAIHAANEKELDIFARAVDAARDRDLQ